tara:strand:+ start:51376 stop:52038 length:663 start_codon:yes stop_codon:yes gene_type:complete
MKLSIYRVILLTIATLVPVTAQAYESGDWLWRFNMMMVQPQFGGDEVNAPGAPSGQLQLGEEIMPSLQVDYMLADRWALGVGLPLQELNQTVWLGSDSGSVKVAKAETLPVAVTLSYYLPKWKNLRSYLIGGWQYYHVVTDARRQDAFTGLGNIEMEDGQGFGGGIGFEWDRDGDWSWTAAAVKYTTKQDVKITYNGAPPEDIEAEPAPIVLTIGLTRRF